MEDLGRHTNGKRLFGIQLQAPYFFKVERSPFDATCLIVAVVATPEHPALDWAAYIGMVAFQASCDDDEARALARAVASHGAKLPAEIARRLFPDVEKRFGVEYRA